MTDEKYVFVSDVIDKKRTARGSHNKRTHCGRGGSVRLPSDNMTRKELNKMNGDVKSYRMNDPMTWEEFKSMPDDLRITYIKLQSTTDDTEGENYSPVQTLTLADREVMWRALGVIEGLSCGVCNERIREGLVHAIEKISDVMNGSGV